MKHACTLVAGLAIASPAFAQAWSDNFDSYPVGPLNGPGNWGGWFGDPNVVGDVSNTVSLSNPNSFAINTNDDAVNDFTDATSGTWTLDADIYIPGNFTGEQYFIVLNQYTVGSFSNTDWALELVFDAATGTVTDIDRTGNAYPYVTDAWSHIHVVFDLSTNNTISSFYNGNHVATGDINEITGGPTAVAAIDLFSNGGSTVYYDNINFIPTPASCSLLALGALAGLRRRRA